MKNFKADSRVGLDLADVSLNLPSLRATADGRAPWLSVTESTSKCEKLVETESQDQADVQAGSRRIVSTVYVPPLPVLVAGAEKDFIVDAQGVEETAQYFGVKAVMLPELYHDVMLGPKSTLAAECVADWLRSVDCSRGLELE
jgi:alpha-beta hydrolase superfamily lysophospholipase